MKKFIIVLGEIAVLIASYFAAAVISIGEPNTYKIILLRWSVVKANPMPSYCWRWYTLIFMFFFSLLYAIILLYIFFMKKIKMPGKEYGTSSLMPANALSKKLADLNNGESDPMNKVVYSCNYNFFEKLIQKYKHRKDD